MPTNTLYIGSEVHQLELPTRLGGRIGYKVVRLVHQKSGAIKVEPPHYNDSLFDFASSSKCSREKKRKHAFESCSCGFYAYKSLQDATNHWEKACSAAANELLVEVSLSGKIVVAEHGYRSSLQRLTGVLLPPCFLCSGQAGWLAYHKSGYLVASCIDCAPEGSRLDFQQFSKKVSPTGFSAVRNLGA